MAFAGLKKQINKANQVSFSLLSSFKRIFLLFWKRSAPFPFIAMEKKINKQSNLIAKPKKEETTTNYISYK